MSNYIGLQIGKMPRIVVYALVSTRAVSVTKVVCRGRRTWAINEKGRVYCSDVSGLRNRIHRWEDATEYSLSADDIAALSQLGLIDAKSTAKLRDEAHYLKDYQHRKNWLEGDVENIRDAGIGLAPNWKAKIELKAHAYAKKRQAERRKREKAAIAKATGETP